MVASMWIVDGRQQSNRRIALCISAFAGMTYLRNATMTWRVRQRVRQLDLLDVDRTEINEHDMKSCASGCY